MRTSSHCPLWGRVSTQISLHGRFHPEGQPWHAKVAGDFNGWVSGLNGWFGTQLQAREHAAAFIADKVGEAVFEQPPAARAA